ncbi:unnamed protein product, partial [Prorocentrum cordatum]
VTSFAMEADSARLGAADVATAEELLSRVKDGGPRPRRRGPRRGARGGGCRGPRDGRAADARRLAGPGPRRRGRVRRGRPGVPGVLVQDGFQGGAGSVGCLGGHRLHAGCAADLGLFGSPCPTCRAPLFYPTTKVTTKHVLEHKARQFSTFSAGDHVLITGDADLAARRQGAHPLLGGWHEDMAPCCGREAEVVQVLDPVATEESKAPSSRSWCAACRWGPSRPQRRWRVSLRGACTPRWSR